MQRSRGVLGLLGWIVVCFAAAQIGAIFRPGEWYAGLAKQSLNPPNSWFAPVWIALYAMMAVAAARVWRLKGFRGAGVALGLFLIQLALNASWSFLFFGLHRPIQVDGPSVEAGRRPRLEPPHAESHSSQGGADPGRGPLPCPAAGSLGFADVQ